MLYLSYDTFHPFSLPYITITLLLYLYGPVYTVNPITDNSVIPPCLSTYHYTYYTVIIITIVVTNCTGIDIVLVHIPFILSYCY